MIAIASDSSSRLREKRNMASRSGFSSTTTSMNCPLPGAGPRMRITSSPLSSITWKASTISDHTLMSRMSTSWSILVGMSATASSRRWVPVLIATARAPMLARICRASASGTVPLGAASSTSAAVFAAASRSLSRFMRKLAMEGT